MLLCSRPTSNSWPQIEPDHTINNNRASPSSLTTTVSSEIPPKDLKISFNEATCYLAYHQIPPTDCPIKLRRQDIAFCLFHRSDASSIACMINKKVQVTLLTKLPSNRNSFLFFQMPHTISNHGECHCLPSTERYITCSLKENLKNHVGK